MRVNWELMKTVLALLTFHLVFQPRPGDSHVYLITGTWVHLSRLAAIRVAMLIYLWAALKDSTI